MRVGDEVWIYNHWNELEKIKIRSIENIDHTNIVNDEYLLGECSTTRKEARQKLLQHLERKIKMKETEIAYAKKEIQRISKNI